MQDGGISRRAVVGSGVAGLGVLGATALHSGRFARSGSSTARDGITFVSDGADETAANAVDASAPAVSMSPEVVGWQAAIGRSFRITGAAGSVAGTLTSVLADRVLGMRPAGVRRQPFWLKFKLDAGYSAASDEIYFVESGVTSAVELFLQTRDQSVLGALLN